MGWKGNLRSGIALARSFERAERRRANESARQYKAMVKQEAFENGQRAVQEYNNYVELISSTHKEQSERIDWNDILNEPEPLKPIKSDKKQKEAEHNLANYVPSFLDKVLGSINKKRQQLETLIETAKSMDRSIYDNDLQQYADDYQEWKKYNRFARGVLSADTEVYKKVLEHLNPFSDIEEIGSRINIMFEKEHVVVTLFANGISVIPDFTLTQTATGKVSKKKMPIGNFYELYQDYICSCVLRVAREIASFLPLKYIFVNAQSEMVNTRNGHLEQQTILSVAMPIAMLGKLNYDTIDPSDSMQNFIHNMAFSKTKGFNEVATISPSDLKF